jgi:IS1 family transposase/transposase-like protein
MIVEIVVRTCPKCSSENIVKNGHDYKGAQKYHCRDCGSYGTLDKKSQYDEKTKRQAVDSYFERVSMRGVERIFNVPRQRLAAWLVEEGETLSEEDLSATLVQPEDDDVLELDELWSFVLKKSKKRWIWIALCRRTRQVVAYFIGNRKEASCRELWERIPPAYRKSQTYSDFWAAYQKVFPTETHQSVGKESGQTNHVERWNNTLRQRLARLVRKTLSFSKSDFFHKLMLKLFGSYSELVQG